MAMVQTLDNLSLIDGPLPFIFLGLGAASLLFLLFRRSLRWCLFAVVSALLALAASAAACWAVIHVFYLWPEELPSNGVIQVALVLWILTLGSTTALAGLRRQRPDDSARVGDDSRTPRPTASHTPRRSSGRRRGLAVLATLVALTSVSLSSNSDFGQFPTVGSLFSSHAISFSTAAIPSVEHHRGSRFMSTSVQAHWNAPAGLPATGTVRSLAIAGTVSGFNGRNAVVYLPPAYSAANRPVLSVLVLVSGQPGSPES